MTATQATLWDNLHLEKGLHFLSVLQMDDAIHQFNLALRGPYGLEDARKALEAAQYWQTRIQAETMTLETLLKDYQDYPFTPKINSFKNNLLQWISDNIRQREDISFNLIETAFDELLALKDYLEAESFITFFIQRHPEKQQLRYLQGQAQWLNNGKGKANKTYISGLLFAPDKVMIDRIKNDALKKIIIEFGPEMAPAYGWIRGLVPFVKGNNDVPACNAHHQSALKAYRLLQQAHGCVQNGDRKAAMPYRKQLKEEAPELYEAYFKLLNQ